MTGHESDTLQALLLPARTPKAIVQRLHGEVVKVLAQPETRDRVAALGFESVANSPAEFAAQIRAEVARWGKVVREAGIKVE